MNPLEALILGIVQGLTEWLPVSSSGHLVIIQETMGIQVSVFFDLLLHVSTAIVVLLFLRKEVLEIFRSLGRSIRDWRSGAKLSEAIRKEDGAYIAWLIVIGSVPTAIIGFAFKRWFESLFGSLLAVGIALVITGIVLSLSYLKREGGVKRLDTARALAIGTAQGIAIIPGISRSGTTITTGLLLGAERVKVAKYSFLLGVPAILGAAAVDFITVGPGAIQVEPLNILIALAAAAVSAFLALKLLVIIISRARLHVFAPYCIVAGVIVIAFWLF